MSRLVLKNVRLSYAHVWEPKETKKGEEKKYSASLIIRKTDTKTLNAIKKAIAEAKGEGKRKQDNKKGVVTANIKLPVRDDDGDRPDDTAYEGCMVSNANATVNHPRKSVDRHVQPIMDRAEVYRGCYANVSGTFYAYNQEGNSGIGCGLGNIQKVGDGDPLSSARSAEDDFDELEDDDEFLA